MLESNAAAVRINSALNDLTISYNRKDRDNGNCVFEVHSCFVLSSGVKSMCYALSTLYCFVFMSRSLVAERALFWWMLQAILEREKEFLIGVIAATPTSLALRERDSRFTIPLFPGGSIVTIRCLLMRIKNVPSGNAYASTSWGSLRTEAHEKVRLRWGIVRIRIIMKNFNRESVM